MLKRAVLGLALVAFAGSAFAGSLSIQVKVSYFLPSDSFFKSIYGNAEMYGVKVAVDIWKGLGLWVDAEDYSRSGKTTGIQETTKLHLIPITAGLRFVIMPAKIFSPYLGAGVGYFQYKETNPIGTVSKGDVGFAVQAGFLIKLDKSIFFDLQGSYTGCKVNPAGVSAELGGINAGLGIGIAF